MIVSKLKRLYSLFLVAYLVNIAQAQSQNDTAQVKEKKQVFFMSAGYAMPLGDYASSLAAAQSGYAQNGFTTLSNYSIKLYQFIEFNASHLFVINKVNADAVAANNKMTIESELSNSIDYSAAKSNNWNTNALCAGIGVRFPLDKNKKVNLFANAQAGIALVNTPATETMIQIDELFFSSRVKRSQNFAPAYTGNIGILYQFTAKTGLVFNTNFVNLNVIGNNLNITDVGNNTYLNDTYSFEQKIQSLNFSIGFSTHF